VPRGSDGPRPLEQSARRLERARWATPEEGPPGPPAGRASGAAVRCSRRLSSPGVDAKRRLGSKARTIDGTLVTWEKDIVRRLREPGPIDGRFRQGHTTPSGDPTPAGGWSTGLEQVRTVVPADGRAGSGQPASASVTRTA
jgi:hypothetical protein